MLRTPVREVEHKRRVACRTILMGLVIFAMTLTLLGGKVKLYELRQTCQALEEKLEEQSQALEELRQTSAALPDLYQRAKAMGLEKVDPNDVEILHIRGQMTD